VMHANEFCETDNEVCSECRRSCDMWRPCPDGGEVCVPSVAFSGRNWSSCVPAGTGGLLHGERCESDEECRSTYCDPLMGRCTSVLSGSECAGPGYFPALDISTLGPSDVDSMVCKYECFHQDECRGGAHCVIARHRNVGGVSLTTCLRVPTGTVLFGGGCSADPDCDSGVCISGSCTAVCRDASDCGAPFPSCVPVDLSRINGTVPRGDGWPTPWPLLCVP
jgi:hypothetical protein